ncbi:exopolysaccharide biosynthesis polyprenyl glycosylphosphotransferase [Halobiforma lacisalsi AJ5]|uniref:Exopolysaccharide biosynthesis polyprenyl glycosylphosphotransferase n=1 Tax=Natronobacterium lacisalsi AJ5 TaxID=358396 RepID=M0L461_NATLA|nr:sugar transferase [Halobiforma lacisalsi]APW98890.1 exopolysaccharide biosynthesis polyprenyl glycosylphosphotransferase [Halobiforma lacisalsi AJ5]EMA27224.1 exopolysaccharide biosynthesis polyprenyl glycosylphosphotransferase [Halobiforma lacisalsi AJ5]
MFTGWRYRVVSALGVVTLTVGAVLAANHELSQSLFTTYVPVFNRLELTVLSGEGLYWAIALSVLAVAGALVPLYKPQPRRVLDTVFLAQQRVLVAAFALATLGYFNYSYRLPRATLVMTFGLLSVAIPGWFVWIRRRPTDGSERVLVVGDDLEQIEEITPSIDAPVLGYLCPSVVGVRDELASLEPAADGGVAVDSAAESTGVGRPHLESLDRIGGLSRLEDALLEFDVDTVVLAFRHADRAEFFGALDVCHEHGVDAKVHREYADSVLVSEGAVGELVDVDVEPWDPLDHLGKRLFDVVFAGVGMVAFAPLMGVIAVAITVDSPGPVLYSQDRTAGFGETFPVYKFRTMIPEGESATPSDDEENDRITRVGCVLRRTHLDELPQLWSIFVGDMSVVGPRAAWTEEEVLLEADAPAWRKRWFVKPGLTGLAQINDVTSTAPREKLRYDLEYIRRQSFWFDLKIVVRQIWGVLEDIWKTLRLSQRDE